MQLIAQFVPIMCNVVEYLTYTKLIRTDCTMYRIIYSNKRERVVKKIIVVL